MRIGIDLQTVGRGRTGDETYYRNLVSHYAAQRPDYDFYLYYTSPQARSFLDGLQGRFYPRKLAFQSPFLRVPFAYPFQIWKEPVDIFHTQYVGLAAGRAKLVLTIHDLSYELYPELFPRNRALFLKLARWSARRADAVVTVSEHTKKDLMRLYGIPENKVHVIYNAADPRFSPCQDKEKIKAVKHHFGISKDFIFSVGNLQPRKNITRLIEAYLRARAEGALDMQLVLSGNLGWGNPDWKSLVRNSPYQSDILFTGYVPDHDLPVLYSTAAMFVYPSLYEGFGLPVVEAMACGTPVIASNTSSLPEVGGQAVLHVDPYDVSAISEAMVALARNPQMRQAYRESGLQRSALFSWERAAHQTLAVYEAVAKNSMIPTHEWCLEENKL